MLPHLLLLLLSLSLFASPLQVHASHAKTHEHAHKQPNEKPQEPPLPQTTSAAAAEERQDVFLQCLNSMFHADADNDNQLTSVEFREYAQLFSKQLYARPIFSDGYLTNELRDLFKLLVEASGGDPYHDIRINVFGSKVDDLLNIDQERFDALHSVCRMTENAFSLLAQTTSAPKTMVMEFTMVEGHDNMEDDGGMTIKIKPVDGRVEPTAEEKAKEKEDCDKNIKEFKENPLVLNGTHLQKNKAEEEAEEAESSSEEESESMDEILLNDAFLKPLESSLRGQKKDQIIAEHEQKHNDRVQQHQETVAKKEAAKELEAQKKHPQDHTKESDVKDALEAVEEQKQNDQNEDTVAKKEAAKLEEAQKKHPQEPTDAKEQEEVKDALEDVGDIQDNIDSMEEDIQDLHDDQKEIEAGGQPSASDSDEEDMSFVWDEAYRQQQYQKNKLELEELKKAMHQEKQRLAEKKDSAQEAFRTANVDVEMVPDNEDNTTDTDIDLLQTFLEEEDSEEDDVKAAAAALTTKKEAALKKTRNDKQYHQDHHKDKVATVKDKVATETNSVVNDTDSAWLDELEDEDVDALSDFFDSGSDSNEEQGVVDEEGDDLQVLSIHTSFVIFNFENQLAESIDIGANSTLDHAFEDFVDMIMATVCDKAGIGQAFGNCSGISAVVKEETKEVEEGDSRRRALVLEQYPNDQGKLLSQAQIQPPRLLKGAEEGTSHHRRSGVFFDYDILNPELYDIEDIDCSMAGELAGHKVVANEHHSPFCQTVFAHFNVILYGLDGDLRQVEQNYMIIVAKGINHGRLRDALQMIDPMSIHHVEGVGERAFPSIEHHGKKTVPEHHTSTDSDGQEQEESTEDSDGQEQEEGAEETHHKHKHHHKHKSDRHLRFR